MATPAQSPARAGTSLIEILVVVAVIAVLVGMLLPATALVRSASRSVVCQSNLRQLHLGTMAYASDRHGVLPPAMIDYASGTDIFWFGLVAPDVEASRNDGTSIHDLRVGKGVVWGCPAYTDAASLVNYACGYGMNYWLLEPVRAAPGVRWTSYQSYPNPTSLYGRFTVFSLAQLDRLGSRALYGDSRTWEFPRWTPDAPRHRGRTAMVYCDGRTALVDNNEAVRSRDDPQ